MRTPQVVAILTRTVCFVVGREDHIKMRHPGEDILPNALRSILKQARMSA